MNILGNLRTGWLDDLTDWIADAIAELWQSFTDWVSDFLLTILETAMEAFRALVAMIPVPEWITTYSLGGMYAQLDPLTQWAFQTFRLPECLGLIALGYGVRLTRKLLTLGQW